jgi:hypothetical protein
MTSMRQRRNRNYTVQSAMNRFQRLVIFPAWKMRYGYPYMTWAEYSSILARERSKDSVQKKRKIEIARINANGAQSVPTISWLPHPDFKDTSYICSGCKHIDLFDQPPQLFWQTVRYRLRKGKLSEISYLAETCKLCGILKINYLGKYKTEAKPDRDNSSRPNNMGPRYSLRCKINQEGEREQEDLLLSRIDNSVLWVTAKSVKVNLTTGKMESPPKLPTKPETIEITVDGVSIGPDHPQFSMFFEIVKKFRKC